MEAIVKGVILAPLGDDMSKHEIDIPGLPEGYRPIAFRPRKNLCERYLSNDSKPVVMYDSSELSTASVLIVEKIQPRRIVLEEAEEGSHYTVFHDEDGDWTYWREVKEATDDKLSLSVEEVQAILENAHSYWGDELKEKLADFIKAK